jgi:hypothetical protein
MDVGIFRHTIANNKIQRFITSVTQGISNSSALVIQFVYAFGFNKFDGKSNLF